MTGKLDRSNARPRDAIAFLVKCGLAAGLVAWLVRSGRLDFGELLRLQPGRSALGLIVCQVAMMLLPLLRWHLLARAQGLGLSLGQSLHIGLIGYFATIFIPAGLGLDGARLLYVTRRAPERAPDVVSTLIMDRSLGLVGLLTLSTVFGGILILGTANSSLVNVLVFGIILLLGLVSAAVLLSSEWMARLLGSLGRFRALAQVSLAMCAYRHHKLIVAQALALSLGAHLSAFTAAYFAFRCLGSPARLFGVYAVTPMVNLSATIPLTPLGLGVSDSVAATLYPLIGLINGATATMLLRCATMLLSLLCSIAFLVPVSGNASTPIHWRRVAGEDARSLGSIEPSSVPAR